MNDTIKSVVSAASLPRPHPPPVVHRHLQIDLRLGVWRLFYFPFISRVWCFCMVGFFLFFFLFFSFSGLKFSLSSLYVSHSHPGHVYILLSSLRETTSSHTCNNNTNINNVCIARRPGLKGRAGIFLFFLLFFKTCE